MEFLPSRSDTPCYRSRCTSVRCATRARAATKRERSWPPRRWPARRSTFWSTAFWREDRAPAWRARARGRRIPDTCPSLHGALCGVKGHKERKFSSSIFPTVFRLNRGNFSPCHVVFCVVHFVRIWEATRLPSFSAARTVINANLSAAHSPSQPSIRDRSIDRGNRQLSEVTEILRLAAGRQSTVKHAASGTGPEIQIRNRRAFQEAVSGCWGEPLDWILYARDRSVVFLLCVLILRREVSFILCRWSTVRIETDLWTRESGGSWMIYAKDTPWLWVNWN